jgi:hypothetical protein
MPILYLLTNSIYDIDEYNKSYLNDFPLHRYTCVVGLEMTTGAIGRTTKIERIRLENGAE